MKKKIAQSVIGIMLSMFAGYLLHTYLHTYDNGYLVFTYPTYKEMIDGERMFVVCTHRIPYWYTAIMDVREHGYYVGGCRSL